MPLLHMLLFPLRSRVNLTHQRESHTRNLKGADSTRFSMKKNLNKRDDEDVVIKMCLSVTPKLHNFLHNTLFVSCLHLAKRVISQHWYYEK